MPVTDIFSLRILPPLAIARMGNSPQPMDNYDIDPDPDEPPTAPDPTTVKEPRQLRPTPTLQIDPATGKITGVATPAAVTFRDDQGRIKPVAPFLEVWAQFQDGGMLEPLTKQHLDDLNAKVEWRVHVANLKAYRRTGDINDQIHARLDWFSDHAAKPLQAICTNFKPGKSIFLGSVQFIEPTSPNFPEVRLRFTPAQGRVFGPTPPAKDPNVSDDVYDGTRGRWLGHFDGDPRAPAPTSPGAIYFGHLEGPREDSIWVSNGYLDDACDGIVEVRVRFGNKELTVYGWISAGPPTFAPDSCHVRTVADELDQIAFGPLLVSPVSRGQAVEIIRRGLETARLMNTMAMNDNTFPQQRVSNMSGHDTGWGRARQPIFPPVLADSRTVHEIHEGVLERVAQGDLSGVADIQRPYDKAGDLSDAGRRRMPGLMRGSDGLHLALTRRQVAILRTAESAAPPSVSATAEANMHKLVDAFFNRRNRHLGIPVDDIRTLADLFSDKLALLNYLRTANAKGSRAGSLQGVPLVVPGQPDHSALVLLIRNPAHPMNGPFTTKTVADTGKTGLEIVEEWIRSLS